jgi:hypothetical protein
LLPHSDDEQERWLRLLLLDEAALRASAVDASLATGLDDI